MTRKSVKITGIKQYIKITIKRNMESHFQLLTRACCNLQTQISAPLGISVWWRSLAGATGLNVDTGSQRDPIESLEIRRGPGNNGCIELQHH